MDYRITLPRAWRPDHRLIHPGTYRVPEDMSPADAERALKEADALKETREPPVVAKSEPPGGKRRGRPPKPPAD
jgi:hypothetical protein